MKHFIAETALKALVYYAPSSNQTMTLSDSVLSVQLTQ